jgi:hypothetical protein
MPEENQPTPERRTVLGLQGGGNLTRGQAEHCISVLSVGAAAMPQRELGAAAMPERTAGQVEHCISVLSVGAAAMPQRTAGQVEHCISVLSVGAPQ